MNLEQYTKACVDTFGLVHVANIRALRNYITQTDLDTLRKEVVLIPNAASMRALWEAGVPKLLQDAYFKRLGEVISK
jgi:hypothetical protein